jgi:DNA-binding IclR family transcriptional regulator
VIAAGFDERPHRTDIGPVWACADNERPHESGGMRRRQQPHLFVEGPTPNICECELAREFEKISEQRYAVDGEESIEGVTGVAASRWPAP